MKTKKISVEFEEVKVVNILLDLGELENYMSKFLALKNHQRNTSELLSVEGINGSNKVEVVLLIEEEEDEASEVQKCKDYAEQFGKFTRCDVETAWIINKRDTDIDYRLNYDEWYIYR